MGQQQNINARRIKPEVVGIVFLQLTTALVKTAVNQDALAGTLEQMTGAGDILCGPVE